MHIASLLGKDAREHAGTSLLLGAATLFIVLLALAQNEAGAYSMSSFEVVRFSLLSFLPLIALVVGNRLVVREYLNGTRLFVEALPIGRWSPLVLKYFLGLFYLSLLALLMLLMAASMAGLADEVDAQYFALLLLKTLTMVSLYWSIVFCFSLCGHLRVALYLILIGLVLLISFYPGIDPSRFAPFELMDNQLFIFERDAVPWWEISITLFISMTFTAGGFILSRVGEGSVADRLARPMTRRDLVALGILAMGGMIVWSSILEDTDVPSIGFTGDDVLRSNDPQVSVLYLEPEYRALAEPVFQRLVESLSEMRTRLGLVSLPPVRLSLDDSREKHDIIYSTLDGVFIESNWTEHDEYDNTVLETVVLHGLLSHASGGRAPFEPYHWILDGFTRWWAEQGVRPLNPEHAIELFARAAHARDRLGDVDDLIQHWQLIADAAGYPSAEALAWSAMAYLESTHDTETVIKLANAFLTKPVGSSLLAAVRDRLSPVEERFEQVTGVEWQTFSEGWNRWLDEQVQSDAVMKFRERLPALEGRVISETDSGGIHRLVAGYAVATGPGAKTESGLLALSGTCVMKHDLLGPFDTEFEVRDENERVSDCRIADDVHVLGSRYAPGDRVYVALEFESDLLHQPLRLHSERLSLP